MAHIIILRSTTQNHAIFTKQLYAIGLFTMPFIEFYIHTLTKSLFLIHIPVEMEKAHIGLLTASGS
ncbi:MAG: hypothetical protein UV33_C0049G0001 [Candidatus Daviesbacteria bacterium GW2011_GWA1_42_6]|uniref:Uncharacterized protein n=1 Tax=Candidatus Daviesbacteria bacterium GW2011_GWA1_42_6 TaxID=1618420 RepID=A0A0G1DN29_9BACT|nr:MAG: hypothetical protein UV33_C0049G0001 [Candidatus Daviesbacteria bacterium GW2011_GWA1_42_6]